MFWALLNQLLSHYDTDSNIYFSIDAWGQPAAVLALPLLLDRLIARAKPACMVTQRSQSQGCHHTA